jgi:hypothetical protein
LVLLALLAYAPALHGWFLSDDAMIAGICPDGEHVDWAHVARTLTGDWRVITGEYALFFRPLVVLTLALDASVWGLRPFGFHLTNVVLHGVVACLVMLAGRGMDASWSAALLAGAAFVLMPLHPESVAWISGRTDIVYAIPALGSIAAFLELRRTGARSMLALSVACYVVSLLAKENAIAVPLIVLVLHLGLARRELSPISRTAALVALALYAVASLAYLWWRSRVLADVFAGHAADLYHAPEGNWTRVRTQFIGNLGMFLFPYNRHIGAQNALRAGAWLVVVGIASATAWSAFRRSVPWRSVLAAWLALLASVAPIATMMEIQINLMGTRMWYLPIAFLCLIIGMACLQTVRPPGVAAALAIVVAWFVLLRQNLVPWADAGQLMREVREVYAQKFGAYAGERIEGLPLVDRGAYVALYNAEAFASPLVKAPPRLENIARYRIAYDSTQRRVSVQEDPAWNAAARFEDDLANGIWLFHPDGAPLENASQNDLAPLELTSGRYAFEARSRDPWLIMFSDRDIAPPEARGAPEYAYLLVRPASPSPPELFWIGAGAEHFAGERMVMLEPELTVEKGRIVQRQRGGFFVYAARLDTHRHWPGVHAIKAIRLDPTDAPGRLVIAYFNIARRGSPTH